MYWTDWESEAIYRVNKFTGQEMETIANKVYSVMDIHVYHPYKQPNGVDHCAPDNGQCSHLCLPAPQISPRSARISCACPNGLQLLEDGLTCSSKCMSRFGVVIYLFRTRRNLGENPIRS